MSDEREALRLIVRALRQVVPATVMQDGGPEAPTGYRYFPVPNPLADDLRAMEARLAEPACAVVRATYPGSDPT